MSGVPFRLLRAAVGVAISAACIWLVVANLDVADLASRLADAFLPGLAAAALFTATDIAFRAHRARTIGRPLASVTLAESAAALLLGYLGNNVLPARMGELLRAHALGARLGLSRLTVLGMVVLERVIDLAFLIVASTIAIFLIYGDARPGIALAAGAVGVTVIESVRRRRWGTMRPVAGQRTSRFLNRLGIGLGAIQSRRQALLVAAATAAAWGATALAFLAVASALHISLSVGQALALAVGVNLVSAIPAGPAYLGTYEVAAVAVGSAVGLPAVQSLAVGVVVHGVVVVTTSLGGAAAIWYLGGWRAVSMRIGPSDDVQDAARSRTVGIGTPSP